MEVKKKSCYEITLHENEVSDLIVTLKKGISNLRVEDCGKRCIHNASSLLNKLAELYGYVL